MAQWQTLSDRINTVAPSATLAVDSKAKAMKAAGLDVVGFGAGEPNFPTPANVVKAAADACLDPKNYKYTPTPGLPELREAIAAKMLRDSGYEVNAARYYLKPLDEVCFLRDLKKILALAYAKNNDYMTISNASGLTRIRLSDIYYIESMLRTIQIHTKDKNYTMVGKISKFEESLRHQHFIRVHKSFLVNLRYVQNIFKDTITLDNGEQILLSKHRSKETHEQLVKYIQEHV